jgi:hypothetical protein
MCRKANVLIFIAFVFIGLSVNGEAAEGKISFGLDGATWNRTIGKQDPHTAHFEKLILLRGILDGMMFGRSPYTAPGSNAVYMNTTFDHLIDALDQFYSDYRNEKIFVTWALLIVSMELNGEPKIKIDNALTEYRRKISSLNNE